VKGAVEKEFDDNGVTQPADESSDDQHQHGVPHDEQSAVEHVEASHQTWLSVTESSEDKAPEAAPPVTEQSQSDEASKVLSDSAVSVLPVVV